MQHRPGHHRHHPSVELAAGRTNLPLHLTRFVGREREIAEIADLLHQVRLLTVTGTGGMGKTRLALQVAADLGERFPDGVWLAELAPLADRDLVPQAVASALGAGEVPARPSPATLASTIGTKQLLLVLDNCEHLVDACAELAERLLQTCPHLRILCTSRESLGVFGESVWRIPALSTPDPRAVRGREEVAESEAVHLFVDRVRLTQPSFTLDDGNAAAIADICSRLDGIPLAIELAAARASVLGTDQLARRLDDRFGLLTVGSRTASSRQQTLQATIDWSYRLLTGPERLLFERLAVFAGGSSLEMIEAVCSGGGIEPAEILDILGRLVHKSLVIAEPLAGDTRYRLLETLRHYAWERLAERGARDRLRDRHAAYFAGVAEHAGRELVGPSQVAWADRLELEHDNLRTALAWLVESADAGRGLRLARGVWRFWSYRGYLAEGRRWLAAVLDLPATSEHAALRADVLFASGRLAHQQADFDDARPLYEESLAIARRIGHVEATVGALAQLGHLAAYRGHLAAARVRYELALAALDGIGATGAAATALAGLAHLAQLRGDLAQARGLYTEGLKYIEGTGDASLIAYLHCRLGEVDHDEGRYDAARERFEAGLRVYRKLRARTRLIYVLESFTSLAVSLGQAERALRLAGAAEALRDPIGARPSTREAERLARALALARQGLDERIVAERWAEGQTMSLDEALEHATMIPDLADGAAPPAPPAARPTRDTTPLTWQAPLSRRETEVVALVAQGLTNREIARKLVISERTTEAHVTHVLAKLGLRSRAQVAVWAVEHGVTEPRPC